MQQVGIWILGALALIALAAWLLTGLPDPPAPERAPAVTEDEPQRPENTARDGEQNDASQAGMDESEAAPSEEASADAEPVAPDEPETLAVDGREIVIDNPGFGKYFNASELNAIGIEEERERVRYWADLDLDFLAKGIPRTQAVDVIPSIDEPRFVSAAEADDWIDDEDFVVGVSFNGQTRAYPIPILNWHEIVNDTFVGTPVVVTYCPLCNSSLVFLPPEVDGEFPEFGTSGRLYLSDLVMYDRATGTFWSQLDGEPIMGPLVGRGAALERLPADTVPYGFWKAEHPDTEVLARPRVDDRLGGKVDEGASGTFSRNYNSDPSERYRQTNPGKGGRTQFGIPINDDRLQAKDTVIGIEAGGQVKAYARETVLEAGLLNDVVGGVPVLVVVGAAEGVRFFERADAEGNALRFERDGERLLDDQGRAWSLTGAGQSEGVQGQQLEEIVGQTAFWFAWVSFNPDTEVFAGAANAD